MKKLLLLVAMTCFAFAAYAQENKPAEVEKTKTAYADVYVRGGGQNLKTTILYNNEKINLGRHNLGSAINFLGQFGWTIDESMTLTQARAFPFLCTRTKIHVVMKKDYKEGENPYEELDRFAAE